MKTSNRTYQNRLVHAAQNIGSSEAQKLKVIFQTVERIFSPAKEQMLLKLIMASEARRQGA